MEIENTFIPGLKLIHLNKMTDLRGDFLKVFNEDYFVENGLMTNFKESYYSVSKKDVIRGMHFQIPPAEHNKLVYINHGSILDVILDIRKSSPSFGQYFSIKLTCDRPTVVYIPIGCAHGFLSLEDQSMVTYLQSSCYNRESDKGLKYDSFNMEWGINNPILSERDSTFPRLSETENYF